MIEKVHTHIHATNVHTFNTTMNDSRVVWQVFVTQHQIICNCWFFIVQERYIERERERIRHSSALTFTHAIKVYKYAIGNRFMCSHIYKLFNVFWILILSIKFIHWDKTERKKIIPKFNAISWRRRQRRKTYHQRKQLTQIDTDDPDFLFVSFTFKMSSV